MFEQLEKRLMMLFSGQIKVPINPFLGLLPKSLWNRQKDFFVYGSEFLPIAASQTASQEITIQADSDFIVMSGVAVVTDVSDATVGSTVNAFDKFNPPFLATITDTGSGRAFMDSGVPFRNLYGPGELPAIWPFPKMIRASSVLSTRLENLTATAFNVRLSYFGIKVFGYKEEGSR